MALVIYGRDRWGARPGRPMTRQQPPREAFIHHSDNPDARTVDHIDEQIQRLRGMQAFHMGPERGWSDIAYHFVVFQPWGHQPYARVFEGRPVGFVPAAQLNHNTGTLAICIYGDLSRDPVKRNTRYVIEQLIRKFPTVETLGGHRDVVETTCPGDHGYEAIPTIARAAGVETYKH
jgi:hypothetical protein